MKKSIRLTASALLAFLLPSLALGLDHIGDSTNFEMFGGAAVSGGSYLWCEELPAGLGASAPSLYEATDIVTMSCQTSGSNILQLTGVDIFQLRDALAESGHQWVILGYAPRYLIRADQVEAVSWSPGEPLRIFLPAREPAELDVDACEATRIFRTLGDLDVALCEPQ